jgi:hypothetical protein
MHNNRYSFSAHASPTALLRATCSSLRRSNKERASVFALLGECGLQCLACSGAVLKMALTSKLCAAFSLRESHPQMPAPC